MPIKGPRPPRRNLTGALSLCIPHPVIQPVLDDLAKQVWSNAGAPDASEHERLHPAEQLTPVELQVIAELGRAEMTMRELVVLSPGHILKLGTAAGDSVVIRVGGRPKFVGRPGVVGKNLAVQISRPLA